MKKIQAIKVRITVFIVLMILAITLVVPARNKLVSIANCFVNSIVSQIETETGLKLSYESLSPSVLSTFSVEGVVLSDKEKHAILSIDKTKISYNIINLIKKDFQKGIKNITIDGILLDVDKIIQIAQMFSKQENNSSFDYAAIKTKIPGLIKLKNISLKYENAQISAELLLKEILLNNNAKKEALSFNLDSRAFISLNNFDEKFSGSLSITGNIPDSLENSTVYFKFSDITDGNYKLNKLNLMATYAQNKIDLQTIQSVNPIFVSANYDLKAGEINAEIRSDKLSPIAVVSSNHKKLNNIKNLLIDTDSKFFCNVNSNEIDYSSSGNISVPDSVFSGGMEVAYSVVGDENEVSLEYLNVNGQNCQAKMDMTCEYKTLQVSGFAEIPYFMLPNGKIISTELYFDPLDNGFMAFSPQLFLGNKALTALQFSFMPQNDSYDFAFEAYDYSHSENSEPGLLKMDGSYLVNSNYIQGGVSLSSLFMDSMVDFVSQFMDYSSAKQLESVQNAVSGFMFSGDVYASTDFKSISFSMPYLVLANTKKDNQILMLAANGNEQSIQLNQLSLVFGKYALDASLTLDRNLDTSDMFFTADLNSSSVPYHFSGSIMPEVITVTGDYGTDVEVRFGPEKTLSGHAYLKDLPISYDGNSVIISTQTDFNYDVENGPFVAINQLALEEAGAKFSVSPKLMLSGNVTKYGAQIDSIAYTDFYSALEGTADVMVNINDGILDSVGLLMNVKNPLSDESVAMDATFSNPDHVKLDANSIKESLYINSQIQINSFGLNRFAVQKNDNNLLSASLFASGTVNHPYVALSLDEFSMIFAGELLKTKGSVTLEDKLLSVNNLSVDYMQMGADDITASFALDTFEGQANATFNAKANGDMITMPLQVTVADTVLKNGSFVPETSVITISSSEIGGSFMKKTCGFDITAMYNNGNIALFSSDNLGLLGNISSDGSMTISMNSRNKLKVDVNGIANKNETNIKVHNVYADLYYLCSFFNLDDNVLVDNGILKGSVSVLNSFDDPVLKGAMMIENPALRLPNLVQRTISAPKTLVTIINNEIRIHDTEYSVKGSNTAFVGSTIFMNKWNVDHIDLTVKTRDKPVTTKFITSAMTVSGEVICDLKFYFENNDMDTTGKLFIENALVESNIQAISSDVIDPEAGNNTANVDISLGNHATLNFDPLLRCVFVPNTHFNLVVDLKENLYEIDGKLDIRSGDIAYLSRNFYIKEGSIKFTRTDFANPQLSITAETRERDDDGENVRIILSAENQYLMSFAPKVTSIPAKSENEIMQLLGQIVVADSSNAANFLVSAGDYALQSAVMRKAENKLRQVLNFDIFSIRTNVLQNTLNLSMNQKMTNENLSFGNLLDNSTVYIGKYLGSAIYMDAMVHFSFEDTFAKGITSAGSLFQPEFGLELESPAETVRLNIFPNSKALVSGNIRMNMAPDINALLNNQFVPSSSLTFTVKMAF